MEGVESDYPDLSNDDTFAVESTSSEAQSVGRWVNSLVLHDAYHTGQIMFIRKLQGSWPSRRSFD